MLEQAQVHAQRIVVVQVSERAALGQLADLADRAGEQEGVVHHDFQVLARRQLDQFLGLLGAGSEWLLDEHMLAVFEGGFGELVVRPHRSDDGDRVNLGRFENFLGVGGHFEAGIVFLGSRQRARIHVAKHFDACVVHSEKVPDHVRTPVPVTDHADSDHLRLCTIGIAVGMTIGMPLELPFWLIYSPDRFRRAGFRLRRGWNTRFDPFPLCGRGDPETT